MRELAMMRMICDTNYILDREDRTSPEARRTGDDPRGSACADPEVKVISSPNGNGCSCWCANFASGCASVTRGTPAACRSSGAAAEIQCSRTTRMPRLSQHRLRRHGTEPAKRQRRHQLRPALESRETRAAHRAGLAQTSDAGVTVMNLIAKTPSSIGCSARWPQNGAGRRRSRPDRRPEGNQAARAAGKPFSVSWSK